MKTTKASPCSRAAQCSLCGLILATLPLGAATVLLNETFSDGLRNGTRTPGVDDILPVSGWYATTPGSVSIRNNALSGTTSNSAMNAYFSAVTLGVGESLTLTLNYTATSDVTNDNGGLGFGLFSSGGVASRTTADSQDGSAGSRIDDKGIFVRMNPGKFIGGGSFEMRTTNDNASRTDLFAWATPILSSGQNASSIANTSNTATFKITRDAADSLSVNIVITGDVKNPVPTAYLYTRTIASTDPAFTTVFDEVAFNWNLGTAGGSITLDNINVTYSGTLPGVPEPATVALFTGLATAAAVCALRRHRK
ncbi:MAG: PEP-CTERM sorting domain-containing protein [Opitutaceae bacterium]|jgi:hypothetical protein|nr:PEP-CTERM sorting domain-containing protein [Opitutaceae bacterium]